MNRYNESLRNLINRLNFPSIIEFTEQLWGLSVPEYFFNNPTVFYSKEVRTNFSYSTTNFSKLLDNPLLSIIQFIRVGKSIKKTRASSETPRAITPVTESRGMTMEIADPLSALFQYCFVNFD